MAKNREASQFNSFVNVNDTNGQVGIANSVGINTTTPQGGHALYVQGTTNVTGVINSETDVQVAGESVASEGDATALAIALG
mgnify:FL=1|tara:strand:- start:26 stop:271 length:246 start_codon:yes stop_codon:yes gene_type:complete